MVLLLDHTVIRSNKQCLDELLLLVDQYDSQVTSGSYQLCLTANFLLFFDQNYRKRNTNKTFGTITGRSRENESDSYESKLNRLHQAFRNAKSLKITGTPTFGSEARLQLAYFSRMDTLALENMFVDCINDFADIAPQIKELHLYRCISLGPLEQLFVNHSWSSLNRLQVARSHFISRSFHFVPFSVRFLSLPYNGINEFTYTQMQTSIFHCSMLDLSFNRMKKLPLLMSDAFALYSLKCLRLRGNLLERLTGIENFTALEELDVSLNCLHDAAECVRLLGQLSKLKELDVRDNPIEFEGNFEQQITTHLPSLELYNGRRLNAHPEPLIGTSVRESLNNSVTVDIDQTIGAEGVKNVSSSNSKRKNQRIAVILDADQAQALRESEKAQEVYEQQNISVNVDEVIAQQRKSLSTSFKQQVSVTKVSSMLSAAKNLLSSQQAAEDTSPLIEEQEECNDKDKDKDSEKITTVTPPDSIGSQEESQEKSNNYWSDDIDVGEENVFLLEKQNKQGDFDSIFLVIGEQTISERDCTNGKVLQDYEVAALKEMNELDQLDVKLDFQWKAKARQQPVYRSEDESQKNLLVDKYLRPLIEKNQLKAKQAQLLYECLKCGHRNTQCAKCRKCQSIALVEVSKNEKESPIKAIPPSAYVTVDYNAIRNSFKEHMLDQVYTTSNDVASHDSCASPKNSDSFHTQESYQSVEEISTTNSQDPSDETQSTDEPSSNSVHTSSEDMEHEQKTDSGVNISSEDVQAAIENTFSNMREVYERKQFESVDYELKFYQDVLLFTNEEKMLYTFNCSFLPNNSGELVHGYLVFTNMGFCLIEIMADPDARPKYRFDHRFQLNRIRSVRVTTNEFFQQGVWLCIENKIGKKKRKKQITETHQFFLLFKDHELVQLITNYVVEYMNENKIKCTSQLKTYGVTESAVKLDSGEQIVLGEFVDDLVKKDEFEELRSKRDHLICVLLGRSGDVIVAKCEFIANELRFQVLCRDNIINLVPPVHLAQGCKRISVQLQQDNEKTTVEWHITCLSVNSGRHLLSEMRRMWRDMLCVPLYLQMEKE